MPQAFVPFIALLVLGYVARKSGRFPESTADALNRFVIDVCLPASILRVVPTLTLGRELLVLALVPWLLALCSYGLVRLASRLAHFDPATRTVLFVCTAVGNTAFLGFPLCAALLGDDAIPLAVVYDQFGSFLLLMTVALVSIARASGGPLPSFSERARTIVTFPPFLALFVALLPFEHPAWFHALLVSLSAALMPVAIFAVGLRTRISPPTQKRALAVGLALKSVVLPLAAFALCRVLSTSAALTRVAVLQSAMPPGVTVSVLCISAGLAPQLAAALVSWGLVLSVGTLQLWAVALHSPLLAR